MRSVWAVVSLGLVACHARIPPASRAAPPDRCALLWEAALAELRDRGFELRSSDPARGTILTERVVMPGTVPCGFLQCAYRDRVRITVAPGGAIEVSIERETTTATAAPGLAVPEAAWEPIASAQTATIAGVVADQAALADAVFRLSGVPALAAGPAGAD